MRGGALPPALLAAALGFALAFAPRRMPPLAVFAGAAGLATLWRPPLGWTDAIFVGCWLTVVVCALLVHLPKPLNTPAALGLGLVAGFWAGAVIAVGGSPPDLLKALPWVLLCLPARWLIDRNGQIAVKVVASWLVAVSVLAATLPATTPTPGYAADHME